LSEVDQPKVRSYHLALYVVRIHIKIVIYPVYSSSGQH